MLAQVAHQKELMKEGQKRLKESGDNQICLEDKIDRLVEALRKAKELADDRYRLVVLK